MRSDPWQQHHHKALDALRSASKGERTLRMVCESVRSFALDKQAGPLWQRHGYREGKKGIVDPSLQEDLEWFLQNKLQNRQFQNANNHHHFQADDQAQSLPTCFGSRYKGSVSRISQTHCHLFVMSLLGVLSTLFPPRRFISYVLSVTTFSVIFIFGDDQTKPLAQCDLFPSWSHVITLCSWPCFCQCVPTGNLVSALSQHTLERWLGRGPRSRVQFLHTSVLRSQWKHTKQMCWNGECSWLRRWKPTPIMGWISSRLRKSTKTKDSRTKWRGILFLSQHSHVNLNWKCRTD